MVSTRAIPFVLEHLLSNPLNVNSVDSFYSKYTVHLVTASKQLHSILRMHTVDTAREDDWFAFAVNQ